MKINKKYIIGAILVISLTANFWYFGSQFWQKEKQKSFNQGIMFVFQTAQQNGEVSMNIGDKIIKLIKE